MINNLLELFSLVDAYGTYVKSMGITFDLSGYPIIDKSLFLEEWPERILPYYRRNETSEVEKKRIVLCTYCGDKRIYPRLEKVLSDLTTYREYMGVVSSDLTVTRDMDYEWQTEIMLLNQMFMTVLAVNKIKVVANLRCGSAATVNCLSSIPKGVMCASSTLGCENILHEADLEYATKIMLVRPSKVLLYGKRDAIMDNQLRTLGIPARHYADVHRMSVDRCRRRLAIRPGKEFED